MHMPKLFTTYMAPIFFKLMQLFFYVKSTSRQDSSSLLTLHRNEIIK